MRTNVKRIKTGVSVVLFVVLVYAAVVISLENTPTKRRGKKIAATTGCIVHLRWMAEAKSKYAHDVKTTNGASVTIEELVKNGYLNQYYTCPLANNRGNNLFDFSESYQLNPVGSNPVCKVYPLVHSLTSI